MTLVLHQLSKRFGRSDVLRQVSFTVPAGQRHALIGPNGAGKSTLLNIVSGRVRASAGEVRWKGQSLTGLSPHRLRRLGFGRSFQITNLFPRLSVWDNLRCAALAQHGTGLAFWQRLENQLKIKAAAEEAMLLVGLAARRDLPAGLLTYAEQRALELALSFVGGAELLLLDEPTAGMSRGETETAIDLIRRVSAGRSLLLVEHDMRVVFELADVITVLSQGEILASGAPADIRQHAAVRAAYLGAALEAE